MSRTPHPNKQVDILDRELRACGATVKRSQLQETVAALNGFKNWNQLLGNRQAAHQDQGSRERDAVGARVTTLVREFNPFADPNAGTSRAVSLWTKLLAEVPHADEEAMRKAVGEFQQLEQTAATLRKVLLVRMNRGRRVEPDLDAVRVHFIANFLDDGLSNWTLYVDSVRYELPTSMTLAATYRAVVAHARVTYDERWPPPVSTTEQLQQFLWNSGFLLATNAHFDVHAVNDGAEAQCDVEALLPLDVLKQLTDDVPGTGVD